MLKFELAGTPGNFVFIDADAVTCVCEGEWPRASVRDKGKPVATLCLASAGGANDGGNWTVLDPDRTVAKQIADAKKGK